LRCAAHTGRGLPMSETELANSLAACTASNTEWLIARQALWLILALRNPKQGCGQHLDSATQLCSCAAVQHHSALLSRCVPGLLLQTVDKWVAAVLRLVELLPMHPSAAFLRAHVQDPAGAEQRQQQEQAVTDADTVQPGAGSKAARQGNSQPHSSGKVQQGGVQIEGGMQAVVSGAVEDLVVEVEQGRSAGRWKLWHAGLVALLAACVAVGAVLVAKFQGGAVGRVISSPRGHRAPRR
jgi:hypothetical protein